MQVSVEAGDGLERKVTVQVPAETVEIEVNNRLNSLKDTVKIDGFRPGKVPLKVIKQKYSGAILQEVAGELMQKTFQEALSQENLSPAGEPVIQASDLILGQAMEYTATFEVYPEIQIAPIADLSIEKSEANVEDSDMDNMIEILRKQHVDWAEIDRASIDGDRIHIDFVGTVDGVKFDGGTANNVPMILGSGQMIPGFEKNLLGMKATEDTAFKVTFPEDYSNTELAGKEAEFAVTVIKVEEPKQPEIDEKFAKAFGVESGDVDQLKTEIRANMERELKKRLRAILKEKVMESLLAANPVDVPSASIMEEAAKLKEQADTEAPGSDSSVDTYKDEAKRRVQLGVVLNEVAQLSNYNLDADLVTARLEEMSKDYDDPEEFVRHYTNDQDLLAGVQSLIMEDMVIDGIVEKAAVTIKNCSFDEVMNPEAK